MIFENTIDTATGKPVEIEVKDGDLTLEGYQKLIEIGERAAESAKMIREALER